jgi:hypothetical protein
MNDAPFSLRIWETRELRLRSPDTVVGNKGRTNLTTRRAWVSEVRPSDAARDFTGGRWEYVRP